MAGYSDKRDKEEGLIYMSVSCTYRASGMVEVCRKSKHKHRQREPELLIDCWSTLRYAAACQTVEGYPHPDEACICTFEAAKQVVRALIYRTAILV